MPIIGGPFGLTMPGRGWPIARQIIQTVPVNTFDASAQKLGGPRSLYLVTTHAHPEHDLGAQAFPATTKLIRSRDQEKDIAEFGLQLARVFASRSPIHAELLKDAEFRKADIAFEGSYDLDLGGVRAQIFAMGANHTRGDTVIWI